MKMLWRNSWGLLMLLIAIFAGDGTTTTTPSVAPERSSTVDYEHIREVVNEMVFESLTWAQVGDVPDPNRPIIYFDENGIMRSLNTRQDLSKSFVGPYAVIALDSIPTHVLEMPALENIAFEEEDDDIHEVTVSSTFRAE